MKQQRIAFFLPDLTVGGVQLSIINLCKKLQNEGYSINLICGSISGSLIPLVRGISVIEFKYNRTFKCLPKLFYYVLNQKPDIMISGMNHCNFILLILKIVFIPSNINTKFITTIHTNRKLYYEKSKIKEKTIIKINDLIINYSDSIICVSNGILNEEIKFNPCSIILKKIHVIPNIVIGNNINNLSIRNLELSKKKIVKFLYVGRLSYEKNVLQLVHWFYDYIKSNIIFSKNTLTIVGNGPVYTEIKDFIDFNNLHKSIFLKGYQTNTTQYYSSHDVLLLNSQYEGLSNVILEALYNQCIVVSSNCNYGPYEILKDKYGFLYDIGDKDKFLNIIKKEIFISNTLYLKHCLQPYTPNYIYKQYNILFNKLITNHV